MKLRSQRILLLVLATFAIFTAACGSEDAVDQSPASILDSGAATAVAAGSTATDFVPIKADMDNEPAAFLDAIPEAENKCLEEKWGTERYTAIRSGEEQLNDESLDIFQCITGPTWARVMAGGLFNEVGELTVATQACVAEGLSKGNVSDIANRINDLEGEPTLEDFAKISIDMISEIIPVSFCLNEDERALMDAQSQFGASISSLECLYDGATSLGLDFSTVFQIAPTGFEPPAEYLKVASDCGFPVDDGSTSATPDTRDGSAPSIEPVSPSRGTEAPSPEIELIPIPVQ